MISETGLKQSKTANKLEKSVADNPANVEGKCALCLKDGALRISHLMPAFAFNWIKRGSGTGLLKRAEDPMPHQDGSKRRLLCDSCEGILNKSETPFSSKFFYPYVEQELDPDGVAQGKLKTIAYEEWLLKFILSLQWRQLVEYGNDLRGNPSEKVVAALKNVQEVWRQYLCGERDDSGDSRSYVFFLQNLAAGYGDLPAEVPDNINRYIFLSVDGTTIVGKKYLGMYSKIGPLVFWTSISPNHLADLAPCRVHLKGEMATAQQMLNAKVNHFIFASRPQFLFDRIVRTSAEQEKISKKLMKDPDKAANSRSFLAFRADKLLADRRGRDIWRKEP